MFKYLLTVISNEFIFFLFLKKHFYQMRGFHVPYLQGVISMAMNREVFSVALNVYYCH